MDVLIKKARVIDPTQHLDSQLDLYINSGILVAMASNLEVDHVRQGDGSGCIICPGLVDLSCNLREPGYSQKGTIDSETAAAAQSGYTHICASPSTSPCTDTPAIVQLILDRAHQARHCRVYPVGALTRNLEGQQLSNMAALRDAGCIAVSNGSGDCDENMTLLRCYEYAASQGIPVFIQAQDRHLGKGCIHEGAIATRMGLDGIPIIAETLSISRHLQLLHHVGLRGHFNQISSGSGVELIRQAKRAGQDITADASIAHLSFNETWVKGYDSQYHLHPPLRSKDDQQALLVGLADGTLDAICSAHQPHEEAAKKAPFSSTEPGMASYDMLIPLALQLMRNQTIDWVTLVDRLSIAPARIAGINRSGLQVGVKADLCLIDPNYRWTLDASTAVSTGTNQPLWEQHLKGRSLLSICPQSNP
jgi:dihydroorotase